MTVLYIISQQPFSRGGNHSVVDRASSRTTSRLIREGNILLRSPRLAAEKKYHYILA